MSDLWSDQAWPLAVIPFGIALTDRTTGTVYNIDKTATVAVILSVYVHANGERIYPPFPAFNEPVVATPAGQVRIFVDSAAFNYELDVQGSGSDPINNQTVDLDNLHELGTPVGWVFGDALEWQKKF